MSLGRKTSISLLVNPSFLLEKAAPRSLGKFSGNEPVFESLESYPY
jgi:hypothetical protein